MHKFVSVLLVYHKFTEDGLLSENILKLTNMQEIFRFFKLPFELF